MKSFVSFVVGLLFALGLGVGGMTQTQVVRGFLDIFGEWNPALIGVMIGAISIHSLLYHLIRRKSSPLLESHFHLPTRRDIDRRLLTGAALFGLGWGWTGICPGPGVVGLMSGDHRFLVFVLAMLGGMVFFQFFQRKVQKQGRS